MVDNGDFKLDVQADLEGNINAKLDEIDRGITKLGTDSKRIEPSLTNLPIKLGDNAEKSALKVQKLKAELNSLARSSKYIFAGLSASAGLAVKKYADFEAGILKVRTISDKSFKDIKKSAEDLSVKYGISVGQITEGNYQLVSSMGDVAEAQEILDTTAKLSIAGFTDYSSAMNGLVAVMNGYKMEAKDAGRVADILMTVQNRGITTVNELQSSLSEVTSVAYNANVGFESIAAAMATITSNKVGTAEAVTGLTGAITELMKDGTEASKNFKKATGEAFDAFMKNHSLVDAIKSLDEYAKKTGKSLVNIFGNVRAGKAFMNLAGANLEKFKADLDAVYKSAGTADTALGELEEGAERAFAKLKEQTNQSMRAIGEALIPQVKELTKKLSEVKWNEVFSEKNVNTIIKTGKNIAIVTGSVWALNTAVNTFIKTKGSLAAIASLLGTTASTLAGILGIGVGSYYGNKVINNVLDSKPDLSNKSKEEKISVIDKELETIKKQLKIAKESNDTFENVMAMKTIDRLGKKQKELEKLKNEILKIRYSNDGYLTQAKGAVVNEKIKVKEKTLGNTLIRSSSDNGSSETKSLMQEYKNFMTNQPKIWSLLGIDEKGQLEEKLNFLKSSIRSAVEKGALNLIPVLKAEFDKTSSALTLKINKVNFEEAQKQLEEKLSKLSKKGITSIGGQEDFRALEVEKKAIEDFLNKVKNGTTELEKIQIKEQKTRLQEINSLQDIYKKKIKTEQDYLNKLNAITDGFYSLSSSLSQLGSVTGSKTIKGIGGVLGNIGSIGSAIKGFSGFSTFAGSLTSLGTIGGIASAGLGIVKTIGSIFGSGKKKKAKIEKENQRQLKLYEDNSKNLLKLTEAIMNNSKKLETFTDRLSDNISKNPTLHRITTGKGSLDDLKTILLNNKVFGDISAVQKDHTYYKKSWGRVGKKDVYRNRILKDSKLLEYLGFNRNSKSISEADLERLIERAKTVTTRDVSRVYNTHDGITKSNVDVWVKNIQEWGNVIKKLSDENSGLFKGTTLGSFAGIDYKSNLQLIKEYKDMLKSMGIEAEKEAYKEAIESMIKGNNILITSMQDVRNSFIEGFSSGKESSFLTGMKGYFNKIFKNVSSVIYDVGFSNIDEYFTNAYKKIANKLVSIKNGQKLDFSGVFKELDFSKLKSADLFEKQYKKQIDVLKEQLFNSGVDLSIVNKILPSSDFNVKVNELQQALSSGMNAGLQEHKFDSFTKTLGQSLYDSTKNSLVKAFSESSLYQGLISKFINYEDIQNQINKAGSFKKAYELMENKLKDFGYRLESNGLGGFDAINNKADMDSNLGNAYYQDKASNVNINVTNNFHREVYGLDDFVGVIRRTTQDGIKEFFNKPKVLGA